MQYCINHPDEISKLSKVKSHLSEVKGIMMDNIEKVLHLNEHVLSGAMICCTQFPEQALSQLSQISKSITLYTGINLYCLSEI